MSDPNKDDPFFIGWEEKPAEPISAFLKKTTLMLLVAGFVVAVLVTVTQRTISTGRFDFGNIRDFSGILISSPTPMLVTDDEVEGEKIFYLVSVFKYGFPSEVAEEFNLKHVTLKGTFVGDDLEAMIEVVDGSIRAVDDADGNALPESGLGRATIRGEIVDSKCHLGVMNPGRFKPHRACAIQCLAGGIPPVLVAQTEEGQFAYYLLVNTDGSAVNQEILEYVAEPVEVEGSLKKVGTRNVLYIDPKTISRL